MQILLLVTSEAELEALVKINHVLLIVSSSVVSLGNNSLCISLYFIVLV